MSKILRATLEGGVVKVGDVPVPAARIGSEGAASSEGLLFLEEDRADYFAKVTPDLKSTLEKVASALEKVASALTALDTAAFLIGASGAVPSPPVAASDISEINSIRSELETLKDSLK